ncbi:MAG: UDP-N-acetylmuramoyl-tripeptide--D-alanyl-D-alanine ligase, partial [Chloroflexi bacterium]|nr:UDP-N-acetylmuramoyl-tripeptide--D-alanyl-D-alanine ligase [Chloroflexota bacterium]
DGHEFVGDAVARGAVAVVVQARARDQGLGPSVHSFGVAGLQPGPGSSGPIVFVVPSSLKALQDLAAFWRSRFECRVVAVTGSVGKSSTKELTAAVLRQRFNVLKSEGNYNNEIGLPLTLLRLEPRHQAVVLEMGMYAQGEIAELCRIARPIVGIVTNVGPTHIERLGTIERIAEAKSELPQALPPDGVAVLNGDDERVRAMRHKTSARVLVYGLHSGADVWASDIESFGLEGIGFALHYERERLHVRVPLLGRHSVHTSLAAAAVGVAEGMSWDQIVRGLQDVSAQLRLIAVRGEQGTTLLDDTYNASPSSSIAALNLLSELGGRKIAVLGDMLELGDLQLQGHELVGGRAAQVVDLLVAVGEKGRWIGQGARQAGLTQDQVKFADSNAVAIDLLRLAIRSGDVILVKGSRGARMEEIVAALALPRNRRGAGAAWREWRERGLTWRGR